MTTEKQILTIIKRHKSKYSRIFKTRCIDNTFRFEQEKKGVVVYDEKLGMTVCRETGLVFNLLRNERTLNSIGDVIKGQITPDEVNSLNINQVYRQFKSDYEMLSEENLKKVMELFGGKK